MTRREHNEIKKMESEPNGRSIEPAESSARSAAQTALLDDLRPVERLFAQPKWPERGAFERVRARARARGLEVLEGARNEEDAAQTGLLIATAELFRALASEVDLGAQEAGRLASRLEESTGYPAIALAREILRAPELLTTRPDLAVDVLLATLVAFAPVRSVSLWSSAAGEQPECIRHAGDAGPSRRIRQLAARMLAGDSSSAADAAERGLLIGVPVGRWERADAVLVGSARPWTRERCQAFLEEAAPMLGAVLERETLLADNLASERALVESSERKLVRLGFDLHDGPIQDVAVLAQDLRLFKDQLEQLVGPLPQQPLVRGRIEDLDAQLGALDRELRRLSGEVQAASVLLNRPFETALQERIDAFATRTGLTPRFAIAGELSLSTSQEIALLNLIGEALSNIREHARATEVEVSVSADAKGVRARIGDNGRGFDLESTMVRAAREGRIGLLAMHERVRLLGGKCRIDSRPGGPTVVWVALDRWRPLAAEARPDEGRRSRRTSRLSQTTA